MKFKGHGLVWDIEKGKILCAFKKGEFETEDEKTIEKLFALGYKADTPCVIMEAQTADEKVVEVPEKKKRAKAVDK